MNCLPVFIASDKAWAQKFVEAGVPIVGDDIKSQVGATIIHRVLTKLFEDRGVKLNRTYQLNFGGNMDFMNMLERERLTSKKVSKTQSVQSQLRKKLDKQNIHIGPSDHVPWLEDRKWAQIRLEGQAFGDVPLNVELKLEVWDSPNSAGIVIDALRCAKLALDRGVAGPLIGPSAYFMKSPRCSSATRPPARWSSSSSSATARARPPTGPRSSTSSPPRRNRAAPPRTLSSELSHRGGEHASDPFEPRHRRGADGDLLPSRPRRDRRRRLDPRLRADRDRRRGNVVGPGDMGAQTRQVFENLKAILEANGATFGDAVKIGTYLTTLDDLAAMREVRSST